MDEYVEPEQNDRLGTIVAIMIALVVMVGAIVAWRASVADDSAGDADFMGLRVATAAEETRAINDVDAYEHFGAYTNYRRYSTLATLLEEDMANETDEDRIEQLDAQRANAADIAQASLGLFPNQYLNRDGSYSLRREIGELWADAAKEQDLDPAPHFAEADTLRAKSSSLLGATTILGIAVVFLTLVETFSSRMRYVMLGLGAVVAVAGIVIAVLVEMGTLALA